MTICICPAVVVLQCSHTYTHAYTADKHPTHSACRNLFVSLDLVSSAKLKDVADELRQHIATLNNINYS